MTQRESAPPEHPAIEWCVRQDFGYAPGCVWMLAVSAENAHRRGELVLRESFQTSPPAGAVETFPRCEYGAGQNPRTSQPE